MSCSRITNYFTTSFPRQRCGKLRAVFFSLIHVRIIFSSPHSLQHHSCKKKSCKIICVLTSYIFFHVALHHGCKKEVVKQFVQLLPIFSSMLLQLPKPKTFIFPFSTFCFYWKGLTLANKPLNGLHAHFRKMCEEMQEFALNVLHELSKKMARKRKVIYIRK